MYLNWISTASFIALNKRGVKTCFNCIIGNTKNDTASVYKVFCSPALSNQSFFKKIKIDSIEHLKQKLSLENN